MILNPAVFDVRTLAEARAIILTDEGDGATTDRRWELETPWLADLAVRELNLNPSSVVLDYGCGIGRLAKAVIERTGCLVIGADTSASMRALASFHVDHDSFIACSPAAAFRLASGRVDAVLAVWVLQHVEAPLLAVRGLQEAMRPGAKALVVNNNTRALPVRGGWADDGINIGGMVDDAFDCEKGGVLPVAVGSKQLSQATWWRILAKRG